ncbi:putative glycosyl transferase [Legionella beliardensis]|uniref:Putative glycosyl transferase n=1 Tax=Legionella beliardensis TaxID=91822 RepID=A0A378HYD1_9GAMM|nr:glycosyltransferase [Legionella beliardensis]STX27703.1 putative glycosyl transferase [Legionella beliardensis]
MHVNDQISPKCAVLMAVYNGMQFIEQQITSILGQEKINVTVFVSIDLSTDDSENWLNALAKRDSRIIILPYGERFGGAARNFFRLIRDVDFADYDYIAFADQDDIWHADKLARAVHVLQHRAYDAYSSNVIAFWPDGRQAVINKAQPQKSWDFIFEAAGPGCTYVLSKKLATCIKDNILKNWAELQKISLHDWYCYAFARANGFQWFIDSKPTMLYRQHSNNQVGVNRGLKAYVHRFKQIKNGWWLSQAYLIAELIGLGHHDFIRGWSSFKRKDFLRLALNAYQCRRDHVSQVVFFMTCLLFAIMGGKQTITPLINMPAKER